jgi:hypothetical protein
MMLKRLTREEHARVDTGLTDPHCLLDMLVAVSFKQCPSRALRRLRSPCEPPFRRFERNADTHAGGLRESFEHVVRNVVLVVLKVAALTKPHRHAESHLLD